MLNLFLISILVLSVSALPLSLMISQVSAADPVTVLTSKWTRSGLGTNWEGGVVLGDVTGDGVEDVVYGGNDNLVVLNGVTGSTIASYAQTRIGQYCQPQCYDVDGDGVLDILVPLYYQPGLAAVKYDGDNTLQQLWITNTEGSTGSGSVMAKPVAGDIDGDGKLDIFIASQDVSPGGFNDSEGLWNAPNGYDGTVCRINATNGNIIAQTFTWRPCSGGLSLADTDNDGVFELYQGDRGIYYGDGNYGAGERSWWAENLSIRWNRYDALTSSQAPALVDVNNDGILDVVTGMYSEMSVLNSSNGQWIKRLTSTGTELPPRGIMSVHYGITVYDIDADGHLELLTNDGDHDDNNATDVYDLVTGQLKAQLPLGNYNSTQPYDNKWAPLVADIYPNGNNPNGSPRMEIITGANTTRTTTYTSYPACILIFDNQYNLLQNITGLNNQVGYPIVQDIDNDGLLELVAIQNNGYVRAYDTSAPAPGHNPTALPGSHRIRSEVTYFSEKRTGAAVYNPAPWAPDYWTTPLVAPIYPSDNSLKIPQSTTSLSFKLRDHQTLPLNYTITTSPNIGSASGSNTSNTYTWGVYTLNFNKTLEYDTTYTWTVNVSDGTHVTQRSYSFRTALAPNAANSVPTQGYPSLSSQDGFNGTSSTFIARNQTTTDPNTGDKVTNTYLWSIGGQQVANVVLPFNTRNETIAKDYSAYGNNGIITGATWISNGKVGGAYRFDGQNDVIAISDGGAGYYDNKTHSDYNPELGGNGTWTEITVEAWINLANYNNGSRIVAKLPSYEIGFTSNFNGGASTTLMASVWPYSGLISSDDNHAASDRSQTVSASVNLALNTWYHIAFTYKSGVGIKLYLNGELVAERTGVSGPIQNSLGAPIYIGRLVQPFAGIIDEVQIYPYALSNTNINSYYLSTKDGLSENSTFYPAGIAAQGSTLSCTVIPSDSYGDGIPRSASITLNPALPVASNLQVTPTRSSNARLDGENLGAVYTYTNIDGITESGSQIRWYMNGTLQNSLNDTTTIPAATTQIGQTWYFTVTPRTSGGIFGVTQTSPTITIRNNTAPTTGIPTLNSTDGGPAFDDEDLTCTAATTTDADGDETTNIFHWTKGGVSQTNLQVPFDTEVPSISGSTGSTRDYSGYNNNGQVNGATWIKDGVVGGGFSFDGNDYIRVQESGNTLGRNGSWSKVSVEFWIKATGVTSAESAIIKHNNAYSTGSSSYGVGYRVDFRAYANQDRFYWYVYNSTSSASIQYSDTTNFGLWHHIVCTYESGIGLKLYVDGIVRASTPFSGNINATLDGLLDIGGLGSGTGDFSGLLDEVRIYPNALSAAQVFQRFIETKDGQSTSSSIVAQETSTGDNWVCQVTPNDMWVDGTAKNSSSLTVAAVSGNSRPRIDSYSPTNSSIGVNENATLSFTQVSSDPNNDTLTYSWTLDTVEQATTQNWTYSPNFTSQGSRNIRVTVSDGSLTDYQEWTVNVVDVPNEFVNLTIIASANGNTNPIPGTYQFGVGSNTTVQAIPNSGYILSHWLLNGTNVGSANPCSMTMNANYNLTAVFNGVPPPIQYNLHVEVSGSGITNATGDSLHENGTAVSIKATANTGWTFSHWLRNGTNIGSTNPYSQSINANYNFTAVFVLEEYTLTINIVGDGSVVKSPNQITYHYGDDVQLTADPGDGWRFAGWSGDATGIELVKIIDMTGNKVVTATFQIINPPNPLLFEDGFESNSFSAWSSTTRTTGETTSTVSNIVHTDSYGAMFTSNGGLSYERAYATRSGLSLPEIFVRAYVYVDQSGTADNGDRFYFMQLMSGTNIIAYAGWRQDSSGNLHWHIMIRDGTSYVGAYSATVPATDSWYCLELHWKANSTIGLGELFVNDQLVVSITNRNTANYGSATSARIGLPEIYNCASTTVYVDDVAIDESYIGPLEEGEPEYVSLTIGSASFGVTNPIAGTYQYEKNDIVYITATANPGYILIGWTIDGTGVAPTNPYSLTMNADHSLTPIFAILPPVYYDLTVATSGSGSTNATGTNSYLEDSMVTVLATASENYVFSYWLLNGTNVGSANPYIVTVDANYGLTAVFIETSANVFEDGFESGSFGAWSSTSATSGETRSVVAVPVYSGVYAASFTTNGGGGYEKAYLIESLSSSLGVVSVEGKFMISQNGIVESGDRVKLIELRSGSSIIAAAGLRQRTSGLSLWLETRDGTSYVETYAQSSVDISQWFTLELQWLNDASTGSSSLLINGTPLIQVSNDNTSNYGDCTEVRIGLPEVYNCGSITLYVDDIIINNTL